MSSRMLLSEMGIACFLVLMTGGCDRQSPAPEQAASPAVSPDEAAPATASKAPVGKVDRSHKGEAAPATAFADPAGKPVTLAAFRGKPVLVNLWATWCAPCIAEMPTLDALARTGAVPVIAVSQDLKPEVAAPFFATRRLTALRPYTDAQTGLSLALGANLPTTILYDAGGRELWRVTGGFDWTSTQAKALVAEG